MGEGQVCLPGRRPLETGPSKLFRSTLWPDRQRRRQVSGPKTHRSCLPIKMKCCPKADARKITRADHEDDRQVARDIAKTKQYAISMRLRKEVEVLFAQRKRLLGLGRLRLRGPYGANDEFLLSATDQNLRKLAKTFPAPQQTRKA